MQEKRRRTNIAVVAAGLCWLGVSGCKPQVNVRAPATRAVEINVHPSAKKAQQVDENDPRLLHALQATEALLGHPVTFEFDLRLAPTDDGRFLESMFDAQVGRIPRELGELQETYPEAFAYARNRVKVITFRYDGSASSNGASFDPATGVIFYELPSAYLGRGSLAAVLRSHHLDAYDESFDRRRLADVRDAELLAYTQWIEERRRIPKEDVLFRASQFLAVYQRLVKTKRPPREVLSLVRAQVPRHASYLADQFRNRAEGRGVSPLLGRVALAYGAFVKAEFEHLGDRGQATVLAELFPRRTDVTGRASDRFIRDAYPGVDRLGFGLKIATAWLAAGAPDRLESDALTRLICPRGTMRRPIANPHCRSGNTIWAYAVYDARERKRVAAALRKANDTRLTLAALTAMHEAYPEGMRDVLRRLKGNAAQRKVGVSIAAGD